MTEVIESWTGSEEGSNHVPTGVPLPVVQDEFSDLDGEVSARTDRRWTPAAAHSYAKVLCARRCPQP